MIEERTAIGGPRWTRVAAVLLAAAASLVSPAPDARADERVLSFDADVTVEPDGALTVTETIRVRAEGHEIKRGIHRDFPTTYSGSYGIPITVPFEVVSVTRNGTPEPYDPARRGNGVRAVVAHAEGRRRVFVPIRLEPGVKSRSSPSARPGPRSRGIATSRSSCSPTDAASAREP